MARELRAWAINQPEKARSVTQYGPRTRLVRGIETQQVNTLNVRKVRQHNIF